MCDYRIACPAAERLSVASGRSDSTVDVVRPALAQEALELAREHVARRQLSPGRAAGSSSGGALEALDEGLDVRVRARRRG